MTNGLAPTPITVGTATVDSAHGIPLPPATSTTPAPTGIEAATARSFTAGNFYRPELDGLRFLAFLAVFVNHTLQFGNRGQHHLLPDAVGDALGVLGIMGAFGVDLFFVLSAYLITALLLRESQARGLIDVRAFYMRRILRIWPLYFFYLAFAYVLTFFVTTEHFTFVHLAAFMLFSGNWMYILKPVTTIAAPLWSISVEEQFYLLWPWVVRRATDRKLVMLAALVITTGLVARCGLGSHGAYGDWVTKNSFTRVDGLAVGALVAVALGGRIPTFSAAVRRLLFAVGIAIWAWVAADFRLFDASVPLVALCLGWPLVAIAAACMLLSVLGGNTPLVRLLQTRAAVYLGRISYGLYVFHELGLLVAGRLFPEHDHSGVQWLAHWWFALSLTTLMAAVSYHWLEQPFLKLKNRRFTFVRSEPVPG